MGIVFCVDFRACSFSVRPQDVQRGLQRFSASSQYYRCIRSTLSDHFDRFKHILSCVSPLPGDPLRPQPFRGDALLWNMAADMYAWRGQDSEPRPPLLQTRAWQSGEPGHPAEQLLRDETSVRMGNHLTYLISTMTNPYKNISLMLFFKVDFPLSKPLVSVQFSERLKSISHP